MALLASAVGLLAQPNTVPAANGDGDESTLCARCHDTQATLAAATGGPAAALECLDCHTDRRPGRFGRRHMTIPTCGTHHEETRHPPVARASAPLQPRKNCLGCHDVHGSPNLHLVRRL